MRIVIFLTINAFIFSCAIIPKQVRWSYDILTDEENVAEEYLLNDRACSFIPRNNEFPCKYYYNENEKYSEKECVSKIQYCYENSLRMYENYEKIKPYIDKKLQNRNQKYQGLTFLRDSQKPTEIDKENAITRVKEYYKARKALEAKTKAEKLKEARERQVEINRFAKSKDLTVVQLKQKCKSYQNETMKLIPEMKKIEEVAELHLGNEAELKKTSKMADTIVNKLKKIQNESNSYGCYLFEEHE